MEQENYADEVMARCEKELDGVFYEMGTDWNWLTVTLGMQLRQSGDDLRGFSFSAKAKGWLLVVRLVREGIPSVVYVNRITPSDCVHKLRQKWYAGTLTFFPDRYA